MSGCGLFKRKIIKALTKKVSAFVIGWLFYENVLFVPALSAHSVIISFFFCHFFDLNAEKLLYYRRFAHFGRGSLYERSFVCHQYDLIGKIESKGQIVHHRDDTFAAIGKRAQNVHQLKLMGNTQFNLGNIYYFGKSVSKNYAEAVKWWRKAAEQGDVGAQFGLGHCYYAGFGVSKDQSLAKYWILKSAQGGYEPAINFIKEQGW